MSAEIEVVPLDPKMGLSLCLVSYGQMLYQTPCPDNSDIPGWNLAVNAIRARIDMDEHE